MSLLNEVVFSCDGSGGISVWEPKGGTLLMSYKGAGVLNPQATCLLGNDYVLGVEKGKPMIYAWPINSQEKAQLRLICPGRISSMQASPDTAYIAVSIETKLHIWQIASGRLLATASSHYQPITVVKWSADGNFVITGGEDGNVCIWQLSRLVCKQTVAFGISGTSSRGVTGLCEPLHVKSQHSLPVTNVALSKFSARTRVASVSHDRTCKIFDLVSGEDLLTLILDTRLTCVAFDLTEDNIYVGTSEGVIKSVSLRQVPRTRDHHVQDSTARPDFIGHEKQVTSLSVSITGVVLISTSLDETLKIWHSVSRQCLRTISSKGAVLGAFLTLVPPAIHDYDFNPKVLLKSFDKTIETNSELLIEINSSSDLPSDILSCLSLDSSPTQLSSSLGQSNSVQLSNGHTTSEGITASLSNGQSSTSVPKGPIDSQIEMDKLKKINRSLYEYCVTHILRGNRAFEKANAGKGTTKKRFFAPSIGKHRKRSKEDMAYEKQKMKPLGPKGKKKCRNNTGGKLNFGKMQKRESALEDILKFSR